MADVKPKKWVATGVVSGGKHLGTVVAASEEEAIERAWKLDTVDVGLCHHCSAQIEDPEITEIVVSEADRG